MSKLRRHLRAWTTAWLVCQTVALSAFAPQSCCLAHAGDHATHEGHAGAAHPICTDSSIPADRCPMRGVTGEVCPMHREQQAQPDVSDPMHSGSSVVPPSASEPARSGEVHRSSEAHRNGEAAKAAPPARGECAMRGLCNGPSVAIASLFPMPAVLTDAPEQSVDFGASPVIGGGLQLPPTPVSPDTPPPRA